MTAEAEQFCRDLEAYLCRRNGGHLVRVVGPAFEMVHRWFQMGVPFGVACQGIDRKVDRDASKASTRRRPIRMEFCEADVLDAFDDWRRAVGISAAEIDQTVDRPQPSTSDAVADGPVPRPPSLATHLDRVMARLTGCRTAAVGQPGLQAALEAAERQIDRLASLARGAMASERLTLVERLVAIDAELMATIAAQAEPALVQGVKADATAALAPFKTRLEAAAFDDAHRRAMAQAFRQRLGLPVIVPEFDDAPPYE